MKALDKDATMEDAEKDWAQKMIISRFYRESGPAKCQGTLEHVTMLVEAGNAPVCFSHGLSSSAEI